MTTLNTLSDVKVKFKNNLNILIVLFLTKKNMIDYGRTGG